jgi:hypothetical protein
MEHLLIYPHALDVALWRRTKDAAVLATELRGAFIPDTPSGVTRIDILVHHQSSRILQAQLLPRLTVTHDFPEK